LFKKINEHHIGPSAQRFTRLLEFTWPLYWWSIYKPCLNPTSTSSTLLTHTVFAIHC